MDTMHTGNFDLVRYAWIADYDEPSTFLNNFLSNSSENTAKFVNADYDRAIHAASAATPAEAGQYYTISRRKTYWRSRYPLSLCIIMSRANW